MTAFDDRLRAAADELYAAAPSEFIAHRKRLAAAADDRKLAAAISRLVKPSAAAALVNALVRANPDAVGSLIEIGDRLREAEDDGDAAALRTLAGERRRAVADAKTAAVAAGGPGSSSSTAEAVDATLQAAVINTEAAAAVASGLLVKALSPGSDVTGTTALDVDPSTIVRPTGARAGAKAEADNAAPSGDADKRHRNAAARRARDDVNRAEKEAEDALARLEAAEDALGSLRSERDDVRRRLATMRDELVEIERRASSLERDVSQAEQAEKEAASTARRARRAADVLKRKLAGRRAD